MTVDLTDYKAFSSFAPLYTDKKRELMLLKHGRIVKEVLEVLAEHASPTGCYFVGVRGIMEIAHYGEYNVKKALETLYDMDWIRVHRRIDPVRAQTIVDYQISPWVIWIAPTYIEQSISLWFSACLLRNEMFNGQPESESRIRIQNPHQNQNQNQHHHHHQNRAVKTADDDADTGHDLDTPRSQEGMDYTNPDGTDDQEQREARKQAASRQQRKAQSPPNSAPPPLSQYQLPLPDPDAESLAQRIRASKKTHLTQARQLVAAYGVDKVNLALRWVEAQKSAGQEVKSEFGLLHWRLKAGAVDESDKLPTEADKFKHSEYADFYTT